MAQLFGVPLTHHEIPRANRFGRAHFRLVRYP